MRALSSLIPVRVHMDVSSSVASLPEVDFPANEAQSFRDVLSTSTPTVTRGQLSFLSRSFVTGRY